MVTTDGRPLLILHPGFHNREAGPDFRQAVLRFGDRETVTGDVEIDLLAQGWRQHGHFQNPAYADVVLHVVWNTPTAPTPESLASPATSTLPTLVLRHVLDAPAAELFTWAGGHPEIPPESLAGQCAAPLRQLKPEHLSAVLRQAAQARLLTKSHWFQTRARVAGWHQALWEGVFRALGYKQNAWPMQRLAELLPVLRQLPASDALPARLQWEARLLGLSGLLPAEPRPGTHARKLWDLWWRERDPLRSSMLPPALWRLNGVRPVNHPQRRLALAAAWVAETNWPERLDAWFQEHALSDHPEHALLHALQLEAPDPFWRRHYTLSSRPLPHPVPILGAGRLNDLAVNVVLPWLRARAEAHTDPAIAKRIEDLYFQWPAGEDNAPLKLARARLFGEHNPPITRNAASQQGLLQIVRDFCSHTNPLCDHCRFPTLVQSLTVPSA